MSVPYQPRRVPALAVFLTLSCLASASLWADIYDDAVAHAGRPDHDLKRDAIDQPAEILRHSGIRPGWVVGDFMAADGYYSELVSYIVGPRGHVYLLNNTAYDDWSENRWKERVARLSNVEHRTEDFEHLDLKPRSLDAILMIKVYHDLYWVDNDPKDHWPKFNVDRVLREVSRVLKTGGILVVEDHSAKPGTGTSAAGELHRIDEAYTLAEFQKHGFKLIDKVDVLRRPDDARDQITYKGPMVGKTDRFVLVFQKVD